MTKEVMRTVDLGKGLVFLRFRRNGPAWPGSLFKEILGRLGLSWPQFLIFLGAIFQSSRAFRWLGLGRGLNFKRLLYLMAVQRFLHQRKDRKALLGEEFWRTYRRTASRRRFRFSKS